MMKKLSEKELELLRRKARRAAKLAEQGVEDYILMYPTLDKSGYPIDPWDDPYLDDQARELAREMEEWNSDTDGE